MYSLRRVLAVRFCITMAAALLLIALWAFLGTTRMLNRQLDVALGNAALMLSATVARDDALVPFPDPLEFQTFVDRVNRFVVLRDSAGRILSVNIVHAADLPFDANTLRDALREGSAYQTASWAGSSARIVYQRVPDNGGQSSRVIQMAASLDPTRAAARDVLLLMLGTVLLGVVATVFGARWLATRAMEPVEQIADQASAVHGEQTGQRITAHTHVREFHGLITQINRMIERLDRSILAERRIIADLGHDLRTPITAMRGQLEVALRARDRSPEQYRTILESLLEEVEHLAMIGESVLIVARADAGELEPRVMPVDLRETVQMALDRILPRAGTRTYALEDRSEFTHSVGLDARLVGLALDQLLDNTVRHTPDGTSVRVQTQSGPGTMALIVEDNGPGLPADLLPHILERFYRADSARGRHAGAGLGLTVTAAIVHAHGGTLQAEAAPSGGLRMILTFPIEEDS